MKGLHWLTYLPLGLASLLPAAEVHLVEEAVVRHQRLDDGSILLDFGKVAFGNLKVKLPQQQTPGGLKFHFGEASKDGRVDRDPPGSVRYRLADVRETGAAGEWQVVAPP
ncbi:family 78 glycoside hydrolase catalytic domain, partial [Verrucomicrobiaceae bacterium E54]|nr:family 78 glycoside hydrolase catalytic domain [Verrucomicrobiaceae bacterium E54]